MKTVDNNILLSRNYMDSGKKTEATIHLSDKLARYLDEHNPYPMLPVIFAQSCVIDGERCDSINGYAEESRKQEQLRREKEEREQREKILHEQEEARKAKERDRIQAQIQALNAEKDPLHGLFAGIKRKKLQARIDELNVKMRFL